MLINFNLLYIVYNNQLDFYYVIHHLKHDIHNLNPLLLYF